MDSEKTPKLTILGPILGVLKWDNFRTSKTVRLSPKSAQMVVFEDKIWTRQKKRVPKNGPKNGLRKDSKIDNFGTHFRGTKMGQFSDLKKGPTQPKINPNGSV